MTRPAATAIPWQFRARFRARAFGYRSSKLAIQRLRQAESEILTAARSDPARAAEGVVLLAERLWPALEGVDSSSGSLGTAVCRLVDALIPPLRDAPLAPDIRHHLLERLWQARLDDGVDFTVGFAEHWGELCASELEASRWADRFLPEVRHAWSTAESAYAPAADACFTSLLAAKRYGDVFDLIAFARRPNWRHRLYGAQALAAQGRVDEAIHLAETTADLSTPLDAVPRFCEQALLAAGRREEAYRLYAFRAHPVSTYLNYFRSLARTYPEVEPDRVLDDLIARSPGTGAAWFATAVELGRLTLALELASRSRTDPRTLMRAARDHTPDQPAWAVEIALLALAGMARGDAYELDHADVAAASSIAIAAAEAARQVEQVRERMLAISRLGRDWAARSIEATVRLWERGETGLLAHPMLQSGRQRRGGFGTSRRSRGARR